MLRNTKKKQNTSARVTQLKQKDSVTLPKQLLLCFLLPFHAHPNFDFVRFFLFVLFTFFFLKQKRKQTLLVSFCMSKTSTTSYWVKQISFVLFALLLSLCYCFSLFLYLFLGFLFVFSGIVFRKINCSRFQFILIFVVYCLSKICISLFVLCFCFVFSCCNGCWLIGRTMTQGVDVSVSALGFPGIWFGRHSPRTFEIRHSLIRGKAQHGSRTTWRFSGKSEFEVFTINCLTIWKTTDMKPRALGVKSW